MRVTRAVAAIPNPVVAEVQTPIVAPARVRAPAGRLCCPQPCIAGRGPQMGNMPGWGLGGDSAIVQSGGLHSWTIMLIGVPRGNHQRERPSREV